MVNGRDNVRAARVVRTAGTIVALVLALGGAAAAKQKAGAAVPAAAPGPAWESIGAFAVVTAEQIAASGAPDIAAALALVPTLRVDAAGGPAAPVTLSLRGSSSAQVLVLVDGRRVSREPGAAFDLNDLGVRVERVARIEVTPAPASVAYGPEALGGVVNIVTRPVGLTSALGVSYGRGADAEQRIAGGVQFGFKRLGLRLDAQLLNGDGFLENGDYDLESIQAGMGVAPAPWGLDVRWTSLTRASGVPAAAPEARRSDAQDGLRADVLYAPGGNWGFKAGAFTRSHTLRLTGPHSSVFDPLDQAAPAAGGRESSSYGLDTVLTIDTKGTEIYSVGAEWVSDRIRGAGAGDDDRVAERWALYVQDQWRTGGWSAVGALRRDQHSVYGGRTIPSLSVSWGGGGWQLWSGWARSWRAPSYDELYADDRFAKGDPALGLETAESLDGGLALGGDRGRVRVSAFRRRVGNLIAWADADGDSVYRPVALERATVSGWEAEVLYRPSASISIPIGYQRLSTRDDATGEGLPGAVKSLWRGAIQGAGTSFSWSLEYAATNRTDPVQPRGFANFTSLNAAVAWRDTIGSIPVRVSLRAENLLDRDAESASGAPVRGRSWFAELEVGL